MINLAISINILTYTKIFYAYTYLSQVLIHDSYEYLLLYFEYYSYLSFCHVVPKIHEYLIVSVQHRNHHHYETQIPTNYNICRIFIIVLIVYIMILYFITFTFFCNFRFILVSSTLVTGFLPNSSPGETSIYDFPFSIELFALNFLESFLINSTSSSESDETQTFFGVTIIYI